MTKAPVKPFKKVPLGAISLFVEFNPLNYVVLRRVSKLYRRLASESIDEMSNQIENKFVAMYFESLFFKRSYTWSKPISVCG